MDADALERERALEARVADLERRLAQLESSGAAGATAPPSSEAGPILAAAPTAAPVASAPPPPAAVPTPSYWRAPTASRPRPSSGPLWGSGAGQLGDAENLRRRLGDFEARLTGRALAWVGGLAIVLGAIFFLSLAFSRGWIGPEGRVLIGLVAGATCLGVGGVMMARGDRLIGHVLAPVGLAIISISMVGATRVFGLVPVPIGLLVVLASAIAAAAIAVRFDSPIVAAFGLVAVLAAPPLLGAEPDATTLAFVAAVLVGTTAVALWRTWPWLPPIAFLLSAPQLASWINDGAGVAAGLAAVSLFWLLNTIAAGGEEFRRRRSDVSPSSTALLMGSAAFLVWAGFVLLDGSLADLRALFLLGVAGAHFVVGGYFVRRDGDQSVFGLLALATGVAALTMAAPIQLDAPLVPVAWTAEAVAVLWVAIDRQHRQSGWAAAVLYTLAGMALLWATGLDAPPVVAIVFFVAGIAAGTWILRSTAYAQLLAGWGVLVVAACVSIGPEGMVAIALLSVLMVVGFVAWRWLEAVGPGPAATTSQQPPVAAARPDALWAAATGSRASSVVDGMPIPAIALASIAAGVMGLVHLGAFELPIADLQAAAIPMDPFPATGATSAAVLAIAAVAAGRIRGWPIALQASVLAAGGIVVYAVPFLIDRWAVAEAWAGLAIGAVATQRVPALRSFLFRLTAYGLALLATLVALSVAPPARLAVQEAGVDPAVMLQSILALGSCLIAGVALAATERDRRVAIGLWIAVGVGLVYAASVAVVDLVGFVTMDQMAIDERRTLGQTALTLLWAVLGIVGFVVGLARRVPLLRQAGLALLAITTVKVFVFDLAALDVAYRVISLVGLGIILLAGAWLWQRAQGAPGGDAGSAAQSGDGDASKSGGVVA